MHLLAIPLVVAAARIVSGGDQPEAAAAALTAAGHTVVEAGDVFAVTHPLAMLALDAPTPKSWPEALVWDDVVSTCRKQAGPKPWTMRNSAAFLCGRQAGTLLWQRYIDAQHADRVIEHTVTHDAGTFRATAIAYAPSSTLTVTAEASAGTAAEAIAAAVTAVSKGAGAGGQRELPRPLQKIVALPADTGPKRALIADGVCALPSSLEMKNADDQASVAVAVAGAWVALDDKRKTGTPASNCVVRQYDTPAFQDSTSTTLMGDTGVKSYTFDVACPGLPVVVTRQLAVDDTQARLKGASKVATSVAKAWCKP